MKTVEKRAANWFRWMGWGGLIVSLVVFMLYVTGVFPSGVSPAESAAHWSESSETYRAETGLVFKSGWFLNIRDSYFLSTAALAILASTALPTLLVLSVSWFRRRDYLYGTMAIMISCVLLIAILG